MAEFVQFPLPWNIDPDELREIQKRAALRRKIEEEVEQKYREAMGVVTDTMPEQSFEEWWAAIPKVEGLDDSFFDRNAHLR
jgi:hypothetical protein